MACFWKYKVKIYDFDNYNEEICQGLVTGKTMAKAVKKLEEYFNPGLNTILLLEGFYEDDVLEDRDIKTYFEDKDIKTYFEGD